MADHSRTPSPPRTPTGSADSPLATSGNGADSTAGQARQQAGEVAETAKQTGAQVASTVKEQAGEVTAEAGRQAKQVWQEARSEFTDQASTQQQRVAGGLHSLADELRQMADGSQENGVASDLARQAADRAHGVAEWLQTREPGDLLSELQSFARRRPGVYLGVAAAAGLLVGRLTRGLTGSGEASTESTGRSALDAGATYPAPRATRVPPPPPTAGYTGVGTGLGTDIGTGLGTGVGRDPGFGVGVGGIQEDPDLVPPASFAPDPAPLRGPGEPVTGAARRNDLP